MLILLGYFLIVATLIFIFKIRFQEGISLLNTVEPAKLKLLLSRLCSSMQRDMSGKAAPFTEEEEAKLEKSLDLNMKDVRLVIDTTNLILQQVVSSRTCTVSKPQRHTFQ